MNPRVSQLACSARLIVLGFLLAALPLIAQDVRMLFTGDILLSRQVRREIDRTGRSPWTPFHELFHQADWVAGNLEGAVGEPSQCTPAPLTSPCFDIAPFSIALLRKAGFHALGIANNHAFDLGPAGHAATRTALRQAGLDALSFEDSPVFFRLSGRQIAVVAVSNVPARDGSRIEIPSIALRQKLRLARQMAELVVVFIHWGSELLEWPDARQRQSAEWLVENGAGLIIGHHPHVVQPAECVRGRPVFYSLGNHVFDQKYPATKQGLIADCRIHAGELRCSGIPTLTPAGSAFPALSKEPAVDGPSCSVTIEPRPPVAGYSLEARAIEVEDLASGYVIEGTRPGGRAWRSRPLPLISAQAGKLAGESGPEYLFTLEQRHSPIDEEDAVRPYVYEIGPGGLIARWRGSALAWPLLDAALLPDSGGVLCALHRSDSFVVLEPGSKGVRTAAYHWNGFGFSGIDDPAILARCAQLMK